MPPANCHTTMRRLKTGTAAGPTAAHAKFMNIIPVFVSYGNGLQEVAMLGACSKECKTAVQQGVEQSITPLLIHLVQQSRSIQPEDGFAYQTRDACLLWLLKLVDSLPADAVGHILMVPQLSCSVMSQLMRHGLQFTYEQLAEAARHRVAGVERWVELLVGMDLPNNIPKILREIFRPMSQLQEDGDITSLTQDLQSSMLADVLHIAVNVTAAPDSTTMQRILEILHTLQQLQESQEVLQEQPTADLLQDSCIRLMLTAVIRGHYPAIEHLCKFPPVHHLDTAAVRILFLTATENHDGDLLESLLTSMVVPELGQHLDAMTMVELLDAAIRLVSSKVIALLCDLNFLKAAAAAAAQVTSSQLEILMETVSEYVTYSGTVLPTSAAGMAYNDCKGSVAAILEGLCKLPATKQLSSKFITRCVSTLTVMFDPNQVASTLTALLELGPVLTVTEMQGLLSTAMALQNTVAAERVISSPAAFHLDADDICELLRQFTCLYAARSDQSADQPLGIVELLDLDAAEHITPTASAEVVRHAIYARVHWILPTLCSRLINLDSAGLLELMKAVANIASDDNPDAGDQVMVYLLEAPAAQELSALQLKQVVLWFAERAAKGWRNQDDESRMLEVVCALPAAQELTAADLPQILLLVVRDRCQNVTQALLSLPAANLMTATDLGELLCAAVKQGMPRMVDKLCQLSSADHVESQVLLRATLMAMEMQADRLVQSTCSMLFARIDTQMLDRVLDSAMKYRSLSAVLKCMTESAAAGLLTSACVQRLMHLAIEQRYAEGLRLLCDLPAAASVSVGDLLRCAIQQDNIIALEQLCHWPVVENLAPGTAVQLLQEAQKQNFIAGVKMLLKQIPATLEMPQDCLVDLITTNLLLSRGLGVLGYMAAPAIQLVNADQFTKLLKASIAAARYSLIVSLCDSVPAAQTITAAAAEHLLHFFTACNCRQPDIIHGQGALTALLSLLGVQQVSSEVLDLLKALSTHGFVIEPPHLVQMLNQ